MNDHFNMKNYTVQDASLHTQLLQQFIAESNTDIITVYLEMNVKLSVPEFITQLKDFIPDSHVAMPAGSSDIVIRGTYDKVKFLTWVDIRTDAEISTYKINISSSIKVAPELGQKILEKFQGDMYPSINWWFRGMHGPESREVFLPPNTQELCPEYYPDMENPAQVLADYMASNEAVLLLAGPPGTGKTTFLRHMIHAYGLKAHVIYDETLMQSDSLFQDFLFNSNGGIQVPGHRTRGQGNNAMIIEDADNILTSRERDGNTMMSRFLNVSDGLIKLPNRKLIFTTNILNPENMDQAILRPGRCFGIIHTRTLNLTEAQAAAERAGMPIPTERREYTLAEIFNPHNRGAQIKRFGFTGM